MDDLDNRIWIAKEAVRLTPDNHPDKAGRLNNLGSALQTRFNRLGNIEDLENAILSKKEAVRLTPDNHSDKAGRLNNLGIALETRFDRLGDIEDLENAILSSKEAVRLTPDNHPDKAGRLNNLGIALQKRFDRLGDIEDLENAILSSKEAVRLTPDNHPDKAGRLNNLGNALGTRFDRLGDIEDLENAILSKKEAVRLTPDNHPDKAGRLNDLGNALETRFDRLGDIEDLENAILSKKEAVRLTPDIHPHKAALLNNLGSALGTRFNRLGDIEDLENAILSKKEAVRLTPDNHPHKAALLNNLGNALGTRFDRLGDIEDLENAILSKKEAVRLTPDNHPDKAGWLNNLGNALGTRFDRLGDIEDLENAILSKKEAVRLTPDNHPHKAALLNNLGNALGTRFDRLGDIEDLENAILSKKEAVRLTPDNHPDKAGRLSNLGSALGTRFNRLGDIEDLENAIANFDIAVEITPQGHVQKPIILNGLGRCLFIKFHQSGSSEDLARSLSAFSHAARSVAGAPKDKFLAGIHWATCARLFSISTIDAFNSSLDLLPRLAWPGLAVADQHTQLAELQIGRAVGEGVASAIEEQKYSIALEWAEQGRSVVWQNLLRLRTPVDELRKHYPELAEELILVSQSLEAATSRDTSSDASTELSIDEVATKHRRMALNWEKLVENIRSKPEFQDFMRPARISTLAQAANKGPIVVLNLHKSRCDALVLNSNPEKFDVFHIPLEGFSSDQAETLSVKLNSLLRDSNLINRGPQRDGLTSEREDIVKEVLAELWLSVAKPVLEVLAYPVKPTRLPRIWWCMTGPLTFLPIHAAGLYDTEDPGSKVSDYVVSSYTPSITALIERSGSVSATSTKLMTVAMPETPGASRIPNTLDEVTKIQALAAEIEVIDLKSESATIKRVEEEMRKCNWVHFACHGQQNAKVPMESGLLLHDGILKLSTLIKHPLPNAEFAFLSACQTATGDEKVAEESVHLASAMLFAGYRSVIATMWSIQDNDAPKVANDVYSRLLKGPHPDWKESAHALHEAVENLRASGASFLSWVPFIHIGR